MGSVGWQGWPDVWMTVGFAGLACLATLADLDGLVKLAGLAILTCLGDSLGLAHLISLCGLVCWIGRIV